MTLFTLALATAVVLSVTGGPAQVFGLSPEGEDGQQPPAVSMVKDGRAYHMKSHSDTPHQMGGVGGDKNSYWDPAQTRIKRADDYGAISGQLSVLAQEVTSLQAQLLATNNKLQVVTANQGSTYVRWGRTTCPTNAQLVYTGRAGGSYRESTGGSPNRLCLPMTPQFDDAPTPNYYGRLYGGEYLQISGHHGLVVPCSVCLATGLSLMIPGTMTCPAGWTQQYTGHLASEDHNHASIAEYVCLDGQPEDVAGGSGSNGQATYFYYTVYMCGALPCPPYVARKVVTCVVCSKD